MSTNKHLTTRRGFVTAIGFGGVSLYGLWAAYGAAPGPLALLAPGDAHEEETPHGGGHGTASGGGPTADEFRNMVAEFVERYGLPDGSVNPRRLALDPGTTMDSHAMPAMHHNEPTAPPSPEMHHAAASSTEHSDGYSGADTHLNSPIDVYLLAERWFYEPAYLRLDAGVPYRFRMMATDVSHGASIQFGRGGRMIRLRPDTLVEMETSFLRPGSYLVYCTVYCGGAHDVMQARIDVV